MAPNAHSILGASSCHRWLSCPGSVRLSAGLPKTTSSYAEEGTAAHELAELCLRNGTDAYTYLGDLITVGETAYEVTQEMAEAVQLYLNTVRDDLQAAGAGAVMDVEKRFHLDWLYEGMFGTNDALVGQPFGTLRVYDLKYGAGVAVDVVDNPQLMYYALGAAYGESYEDVELVVVQPRAQHSDGPVRRCRMTVEALETWAQEVLRPGATATTKPDAPVVAGEHCKFCPAMAICPAQRDKALAIARNAFKSAPTAPPAPEGIGHAELRKVLDAADMVEAWLNACRAYARQLLETGAADPGELGYKLVEGRASRRWRDESEAEKILAEFDIDPYEKKLKSPAQAEKALGKHGKAALEPLVQTTRGTQLAPLSDKRPAAAALAFTEVSID